MWSMPRSPTSSIVATNRRTSRLPRVFGAGKLRARRLQRMFGRFLNGSEPWMPIEHRDEIYEKHLELPLTL